MKNAPRVRVGLLVIGALALWSTVAQAQSVANGFYYPIPSWDQTFACGTLANCPRFVVLSNFASAAVLDRETGLVWERSPDARLTWSDAQNHCNTRTVGNRKGWRLPTIQELASLIDPAAPLTEIALPPGHPFNLGFSRETLAVTPFWSATTVATDGISAWHALFFFGGDVEGGSVPKTGNNFLVWCVRGGQGVDPQ